MRRAIRWSLGLCALAWLTGCTQNVLRPFSLSHGRLHALLLNGGGDTANNYQSHLANIRMLLDLLQPAVRHDDIVIFSGDGADPAPDLATRDDSVDPDHWLLPQSGLERVLRPPTRYVNSQIDGFTLRPATKNALHDWFAHDGRRLRDGDTLLLYVTDHGERRKDAADDNTITLWGESLSVSELRETLAQLDPRVRVVMLMSQCFGGAFAQLIFSADGHRLAPGNVCGYFAVTADRPAYGCYPENRGQEGVGHSFEFMRALGDLKRFPDAHTRVLVTDDTPDVPFSTVDFWLDQRLSQLAEAEGKEELAAVDALLSEAWQQREAWEPDIRLLDHIAHRFGMFSPRSLAELKIQAQALPDLSRQLGLYASRWHEALNALQVDTLVSFIDANPMWRDRLDPKHLAEADDDARSSTRIELLGGLGAFARADADRFNRLHSLRDKTDVTAAAAYRNEVRVGAVLRLSQRLISIAGRQYVTRHGSDEDRAALQRLTACEDLTLPGQPDAGAATMVAEPTPFPPLADEQHVVQAAMPAWIGVQYRPLSETPQQHQRVGRGAVTVMTVYPNSPATDADLRVGDIITGADADRFTEPHQLREWVMRSDVATPMRLQIVRNNRLMQVTLRPGPFPLELPQLPGPPQVGSAAPPVKVELVQGATRLVAHRPRLLFFWATWCTICHSSLSELLAFGRERGIEIVAITDEEPDKVREFLRNFHEPFPTIVATDPYRATFQGFGVSGTPTFVLIDDHGVVQHYQSGYTRAAGLTIDGWKWQGNAAGG
ncbi:MAG TPA: redoxin family protein [Candidatus Binatia bacterium]|nr:redoxin family protein [Candidatus Binatia bacterium]